MRSPNNGNAPDSCNSIEARTLRPGFITLNTCQDISQAVRSVANGHLR
jgi:hypothetical protein